MGIHLSFMPTEASHPLLDYHMCLRGDKGYFKVQVTVLNKVIIFFFFISFDDEFHPCGLTLVLNKLIVIGSPLEAYIR